MKLIDFINEQDEGTMIHIGSKSAFFMIVTKAEYFEIKDDIKKYYLDNTKRIYEYNKRIFDKNVTDVIKREEDEDVYIYINRLERIAETLRNTYSCKNAAYDYINNFKEFDEREVEYHFVRESGDGVGVKISGGEKGECWDRAEWLEKRKEIYGR